MALWLLLTQLITHVAEYTFVYIRPEYQAQSGILLKSEKTTPIYEWGLFDFCPISYLS
jgi:hypothetical protein